MKFGTSFDQPFGIVLRYNIAHYLIIVFLVTIFGVYILSYRLRFTDAGIGFWSGIIDTAAALVMAFAWAPWVMYVGESQKNACHLHRKKSAPYNVL